MDAAGTSSPAEPRGKGKKEGKGGAAAGGAKAPRKPKPGKPPGDEDLGPRGGVKKKAKGKAAAAADTGGGAADEEVVGEEAEPATSFRGMFGKDLRVLMYGFGDSEVPIQESVDLVEDILVEYVRETYCAAVGEALRLGKVEAGPKEGGKGGGAAASAAAAAAAAAARPRVDEKDIMFLVRKDPKKYMRIRDLLEMQVLIKEARKAVDVDSVEALVEEVGGGGGGEDAAGGSLEDVAGED